MDIAFSLMRPVLIGRDLVLNRSLPNISSLEQIRSPEFFVWKILSYAARTFSACILLLPARLALSAAIAYLYCRILDTYEDLIFDPDQREMFLQSFVGRFSTIHPGSFEMEAPAIDKSIAKNSKDQISALLVNRCRLVDAVFAKLELPIQQIILDLIRDMSSGMVWSSKIFATQGGVLKDSDQLSRYCHNVLGFPTVFAVQLMNLFYSKETRLSGELYDNAMQAGEFIQLANITRDIENDLKHGITYHPDLKNDLGRADVEDATLQKRIRNVREELLIRALSLSPAYKRMAESLDFPRFSLCRSSIILMLLFTNQYYRNCARRIERIPWSGPEATISLLGLSAFSILSRRLSKRILETIEKKLTRFSREIG
jgi:phytoene/squalene synthetase